MHLQNLKLLHSTVYEMHLQDNTLFDPNDHMKGQHHVFYVSAKFEVAMSNGSGEDTITRNMMDGRTYKQTMDPLWYEIKYTLFFHTQTCTSQCANRNKSLLLFSSAEIFKKQFGPRSDCSYRSSLFWVHAVCFYT